LPSVYTTPSNVRDGVAGYVPIQKRLRDVIRKGEPYLLALSFCFSFYICCTSLMCVAMYHLLPKLSLTAALRSP
jgi:hypothetical protein